mgnify:CR=1 FL=1
MNDPIDIKTKKKIIPQYEKGVFNKDLVLECIEKNISTSWATWGKFQQIWTNQAFNTFKDFDKYLVLIYLIRGYFQQLTDKFEYFSYDNFYDFDEIIINKLNLIKISVELNIPKETIRRKINELQSEGIIKREGKKITLQRKLLGFQKPDLSLEAISSFISKSSKNLQGEDWFGSSIEKDEIKIYLKKFFTLLWQRFLNLQIPFLIRHRNNFKDLETWIIWGNIALHHQKKFQLFKDSSVMRNDTTRLTDYYKQLSSLKIDRGVNASSIADISGIPRATVIRKLRWLVKEKVIYKNKNLEYVMQSKGNLDKKIKETFLTNQIFVAEFLTDFFDYYKNSNFKP